MFASFLTFFFIVLQGVVNRYHIDKWIHVFVKYFLVFKKKSIGHDFRATDLINSPEPTERDTSGKNSMYK